MSILPVQFLQKTSSTGWAEMLRSFFVKGKGHQKLQPSSYLEVKNGTTIVNDHKSLYCLYGLASSL